MTHRTQVMAVVFAIALVAAVGTGTAAAQSAPDCSTVSYSGDGTESNPYEVSDVNQLQCIEGQDLDASYEIVSDIDATETSLWNNGEGFEPVGSGSIGGSFGGTIDGNGSTITGLTINRPDTDTVGLFASIINGKVSDVVIENADVEGNNTVGILAGSVGLGADVNRSSTSGTVTGSGMTGGLAGSVMGFVGSSSSTADVFGGTDLGGLVGISSSGVIVNSYARGNVNGDDTVGGLVGFSGSAGAVEKSYATGAVSANLNTGGIIGGNIPSFFPDAEPIKDNYWDTGSTGQTSASASDNIDPDGATGLTTSDMTGSAAANNMQEFDFTNTWKTVSGDYPILAWESEGSGGDGDTVTTASFVYSPTSPNVGQAVTFDASSTDGTIMQYEWDFDGDGGIDQTTSDDVVVYSYSSPGDYAVTLQVVDDTGATDTTTETVSVSPQSPGLDPNNPFGDANNQPVDRGTVINRIIQWNLDQNSEINGIQYTRKDIIDYIVGWNLA